MFTMNNVSSNFSGTSTKNNETMATFSANKNDNALYFGINVEDIRILDSAVLEADFNEFKDAVFEACGINSEVE